MERLDKLQQEAKAEEKAQKIAEDSLNDLNEGVTFAAGAQVEGEVAPSGLDQKTEHSPRAKKKTKKAKKEVPTEAQVPRRSGRAQQMSREAMEALQTVE